MRVETNKLKTASISLLTSRSFVRSSSEDILKIIEQAAIINLEGYFGEIFESDDCHDDSDSMLNEIIKIKPINPTLYHAITNIYDYSEHIIRWHGEFCLNEASDDEIVAMREYSTRNNAL